MESGTLVECCKSFEEFYELYPDITFPQKNNIYTIRGVQNFGFNEIGLYFDEIKNPFKQYSDGYNEASFHVNYFRKLQSPMTINLNDLILIKDLV